jgi:hypothetical protein
MLTSGDVHEEVLTCTSASAPYVFSRFYDGIDAYKAPNFCTQARSSLKVVHNKLNSLTSTYDGLSTATVGVQSVFNVEARDEFANLRRGDSTTHFEGYGKLLLRQQ